MQTYAITTDNTITVYPTEHEARAAHPGKDSVHFFPSKAGLASLAASWPLSRLADIWNSFAGEVPFDDLKPVKKFTDRKTAVSRIWDAIQRLEATVAPPARDVAPKKAKAAKQATTKDAAPTAREGSKKAIVIELLKRPNGATLQEIMSVTGWMAHSVRGFLSGALTKKMGLTIVSTKRDAGERAYRIGGFAA